MKKLLLGSVAVLALSGAGAANAADLLVKAPPPAPSPPVWSWTGFYIGGHIGAVQEYSSLDDPFGSVALGDHVTSAGFIAGGQVGANYQIGHVVLGAEADLSWANAQGDETCFGLTGGGFYPSDCSADPTLLGTLTGRLGYAFGRTLLYAKGGAAWEHNNVDITVNRNPGLHFLTSANSYGEWGWTVGGGTEYALTAAWSLFAEYDYAGFANESVATPYVAGNPLPGHPVGPIAGWSDNVQEFKLGINYKIGADPTLWPNGALTPPLWATPTLGLPPLKAPPPATSGWEIEGGARYMYSSGKVKGAQGLPTAPTWLYGSKVTWNLATNSAELFGRVDSPANVFVSGFVGVGDTVSGSYTDEDFHEILPLRPYEATASTNTGHIDYAVADLGYDVVRTPDYKIGPFVGYTVYNQYLFNSGCQQIVNPIGNCVVPLSSSELIGLDNTTWQAVRIGLSGEVMLADRVKLTADAAYLPYLTYNWFDNHLGGNDEGETSGRGGTGVQVQAVLSYYLTNQLSVGIGGRYWDMWSTSGLLQRIPPGGPSGPLTPGLSSIGLAGAFAQVSYRFDPDTTIAAKPADLALPFFKAPVAPAVYSWTGLYAGIEGGGIWGKSIQIGQTPARFTFDATPWFDVSGGMIGGTVGYNAQFAGIFVYGLEGDMSWVDARGSARQIALGANLTASTTEDWLATARARIGVAPAGRWLVYATGGLAAANVAATISPPTAFLDSESHVRPGWTAGAGIEAPITGNWSAKLEYLYVGLENRAYFVPTPAIPAADNRAGGVPLYNNIVRAGINYRFGSL